MHTYKENGYAIVRGLLDPQQIAELTEVVDPIYAQWLAENEEEHLKYNTLNMHSLADEKYFRKNPEGRVEFFKRILPKNLTDTLDAEFGEGLHLHNTQLFFNPPDRNRPPYWHRDMQYSPIEDDLQAKAQGEIVSLHVRIPMEAEQGMEVIPGTHRRWDTPLEKLVRFEKEGHKNNEELPGSVLIELEPGDVMVFDAQMLHRGNYLRNQSRKALDLCVGKDHEFTAMYLNGENLPQDVELEQIENDKWYRVGRAIAERFTAKTQA